MKVIDNYTLVQVIGQGSYGKVYRASHKLKSQQFAVKIIPADKFQQIQKLQECTTNEVKILSSIGLSQYIIRYYQTIKTKNNYYFIYEYCDGGTLMDKIKKQHMLPQQNALQIFRSLLQAFKILNKNNIMHRDLKPQNIFFTAEKVKLGDFGFCKGFKPEENLTKTMLGSPIYMAPQVLKGEPYTSKADIWSFGVILYQMLYGVCPFQSNSIAMLISTIDTKPLKIPQKPNVSQKTKTLIKKMLTKDYFRRISWVQLFSYKIDENGNYIQEKVNQFSTPKKLSSTKDNYSFFTSEPIVSQSLQQNISSFDVKMVETKKTVSVPKQEKGKQFYSQNYMSIFQKPIMRKDEQKRNERRSKFKLSPHKNLTEFGSMNELPSLQIPLTSSKYISSKQIRLDENHEQKKQRILKTHQYCLRSLQTALQLLQKYKKQVINDCYILLKKVNKKLRAITQIIKITETDLLDMATVINYETIQVDRLIQEIRQQLEKEKMQVPKIEQNILQDLQINMRMNNPEIIKCVQLLE